MTKIQKKVLAQTIKKYNLQHIVSFPNINQMKEFLIFKQGIYMLLYITPSGFLYFYIGSSNNILKRLKEHHLAARNGSLKSPLLYNCMRKYGIDNFLVAVITFCPNLSRKELEQMEMDLILKMGSNLNLKKGNYLDGTFESSNSCPVKAVNIFTMETIFFNSIAECARHFEVYPKSVSAALHKNGVLLKTWKIFYPDHQIKDSDLLKPYHPCGPKALLVKEIGTDKTLEFKSQTECAAYLGTDAGYIGVLIKKQKPFKKKFLIKYKFSTPPGTLPY